MANVLPVLMFKPEKVVLFTTPQEKFCADNLENLFKSKGIKVYRRDGLDAYDFEGVKNIVKEKLDSFEGDVWLNVTGGTKLMALAAYEVFIESNKSIFYCNTAKNQIIRLYPSIHTEKLKLDLTIEDYLNSYGYKVLSTRTDKIDEKEIKLFNLLDESNLLKKFSDFLDRFRSLSSDNSGTRTYYDKKNGIFSIQKTTAGYLLFINKEKFKFDNSRFLKGYWLEDYTLYKLNKVGIIPELGVKIVSSNNVENEIDLIFLSDYKLYLISCKSGRNKDPNKDLYEIETLRNVAGGTFGKAFLITTKPLTQRMQERAKELNVNALTVEQIDSIKEV
jgi:hypothetical protein